MTSLFFSVSTSRNKNSRFYVFIMCVSSYFVKSVDQLHCNDSKCVNIFFKQLEKQCHFHYFMSYNNLPFSLLTTNNNIIPCVTQQVESEDGKIHADLTSTFVE